jgi:hypothetical protein
MSRTIAPKSDQLNADDLIGGPRTITVTRVTGNEGNAEQPVNVFFEGDDGKPFRPCKSMRRVMVKIWGADASKYAGRSMTIFRDPKVKWGGMEVGGIRISHMTGIEKPETMALTETRSARKPYTVQPLKVAEKVDKAAEGVAALIRRIDAGEDVSADPQVQKQREWLAANRPELAAQVTAALTVPVDTASTDDPFGDAAPDHSGFVAGITERIAAATTAEELDEIGEDMGAVELPDDEIAKLDVALSKKRRSLAKAA